MKSKLLFCSLLVLAVVFASLPAMAGPRLNYGKALNAAQCEPGNNKMVLNIVYQVTNDADSGFGGFWALDNYTKHIQAFDLGGGYFCVIAKYDGSFVTAAGPSPAGGTGTVGAGVTGTMEGGYQGLISNATFNPGTKRTKGNVGSYDYGCTVTNGSINATCGSTFDWVAAYFSGATTTFEYDGTFQWGWIYHGGDNGTWVNANSGSTGDITGN
jgi:hypothetical protein